MVYLYDLEQDSILQSTFLALLNLVWSNSILSKFCLLSLPLMFPICMQVDSTLMEILEEKYFLLTPAS